MASTAPAVPNDRVSALVASLVYDEETTRALNARPPSPLTDDVTSLLATKEGEMFLYSDPEGNIRGDAHGMGLFYRDTRFLSHYDMRLNGSSPVLLSSSAERAYMSYVDLTNAALEGDDGARVPQQTLNIRRTRVIRGRMFERIRFKNYNSTRISVRATFTFGADFSDIFQVRGFAVERRGRFFRPLVEGRTVTFSHLGEDGHLRQSRVDLGADPAETTIRDGMAEVSFDLDLVGHQTKLLTFQVEPLVDAEAEDEVTFDVAVHDLRRSYDEWDRSCTSIFTDNEVFNTLLQRGRRDLRALLTDDGTDRYLAAGIPWYVALFGRDSLITSHQILMLNPAPARDTMRLLASLQGTEDDPWRDEEPGKILHEIRRGEMAQAGVIPHTRYYGSVDSTPLFLILYGTYFKWTNDRAFAEELVPNVERALRWIDEYGDADGDGFVEYHKRSPRGLDNQGWKDSHDAILHSDGTMAEGPIALAEVQAYVYLAKLRVADVFDQIGRQREAVRLREEAHILKRRFNQSFWMEDDEYFALALDGKKRPVRSITSNPAHGLYCDILDHDKAQAVARRLLQPDMFSGWGIRTMSKSAAGYNPMSYHNGTVWPHDNAFIAAGLKRYGHHKQTNRIATAIFDAAVFVDYMRLPELFCGFTRRTPNQPVHYPIACSPQAWAAGTPFLLLQAMLGLSARAHENLLTINSPVLPPWLNWVELRNLRVGDATISLIFRREGEMTGFSLLSKDGTVRVIMEE